ncbi:MAG: YihY/virulence factor BrkB family protein [Aquihabitans sp.]
MAQPTDEPRSDGVRPAGSNGTPPTQDRPGGGATQPTGIPAKGWKDVLLRVKVEAKRDNVPLLGAGVAFYALLALVPALVAIVSIYGLVASPADVQRQITKSLSAAPTEVRNLLQEQLTSIVQTSKGGLGIGAVIGILLALWSASSGMNHLIAAINTAYDEEETRGFVKLRGTALVFTVGAVVGLVVAIGAIAIVPAAMRAAGVGSAGQLTVSILRWPILGGLMLVGLSALYRYAPDRDDPQWSWVSVGSVFAVVGFIVASGLFSVYTSNFASFGETYGSLGSIIVVMLWLMISATVIILGAEVNAETEHQTAHDTTEGEPEPAGERGAYVADTAPEGEPATDAEQKAEVAAEARREP